MKNLVAQLKEQNAANTSKRKHEAGEPQAEALSKEVDRFLLEKNKAENPTSIKKISGFHPSYGYACKRRWALLFQGAPIEPKFNARTIRIFDNGHAVHERWGNYFKDMGILEDREVPIRISDPVPIVGHADGILNWGGGRKLYELKSINPSRYEYRKMYNKPDEKTYDQTQMYLYALDLEEGYVIYEEKGGQQVSVFPVGRDEKNIAKQLKRFTSIYKDVTEGITPRRPYKRDSNECKYCDLETYCWEQLDE